MSGNGKTKVVHRNRLKPATCRPRGVDDVFVDGSEGKPPPITVEYEPRIYHEDKIKDVQPLPPEDLPPLRRSTRQRRPPEPQAGGSRDRVEIESTDIVTVIT